MATVVTTVGRQMLADRFKNAAAGTYTVQPTFVGWGTGAGTALVGDTTLFVESAEARVSGTSSLFSATGTNDAWRLVATITASAARAITNAGNFDAATAGNLHIKGDFTVINLALGDSIQFTIELRTT